MRRIIALVLCIILTLSMTSCAALGKPVRYAGKCWDDIGSSAIEVDYIYFMEYTSRTYLSDDVLETSMYNDIPQRGYVVLFGSSYSKEGAFMDSYACFLNTDGELEFYFDFEENYRLYEKHYANFSPHNVSAGEKALEYLMNCNYISGMINYAYDGKSLKSTHEKNVWYSLSELQVKQIVD